MATTEEQIPDIEEAVLEEAKEVTGLVPATQAALDLPACEVHDFVFLRTAKTKYPIKGEKPGPGITHTYHRTDTFYCRHCLRYTMMDREERAGSMTPLWWKDDK